MVVIVVYRPAAGIPGIPGAGIKLMPKVLKSTISKQKRAQREQISPFGRETGIPEAGNHHIIKLYLEYTGGTVLTAVVHHVHQSEKHLSGCNYR